jgi:hypothetical protein
MSFVNKFNAYKNLRLILRGNDNATFKKIPQGVDLNEK